MINASITKKDPHTFSSSFSSKDIKQMLDYVTEILATTYICSQFGWFKKLNDEQILIYKVYGKQLADKLGLVLSDKFNEKAFVWTRLNINNYNWMHTVWVSLNKKYFDLFDDAYSDFKFSAYFCHENIFLSEGVCKIVKQKVE